MGAVLALTSVAACGTVRDGFDPDDPNTTDGGAPTPDDPRPPGFDNDPDADVPEPPVGETRDPADCEEAKTSKSYVGCEYWPTVTPNTVSSIFDFTAVVANTGAKDAEVTITGPNGLNKQVTVPSGELRKIPLPWVSALKGPDNNCGTPGSIDNSAVVSEGAYRLVSSVPVIVYQFNALQYKGEGGEDADGNPKDWSNCVPAGCAQECFSYSNDASLLLPSTAMTNHYRVTGYKGTAPIPLFGGGSSPVLSVTATQPNTQVTLYLSGTATVLAGGPVSAASSGAVTVSLAKAGDVAQFVAGKGKDFSGSLVQSDKPVQVIASHPCTNIPDGQAACDHIEESVLPAETLGKRYLVAQPTGPKGQPVGQTVRLYGNQDGTTLTYSPSKPQGCPDTLTNGQVVDCGVVNASFEVIGDKEFGLSTFLLGASVYKDAKGDPSQSNVASVEQFRTKYVFLAPTDYPVRYADITAEQDADIEIDGQPISAQWTPIGAGPFGVYRVDLTKSGKDGAHTLSAKKPVGAQVIGFGDYTSFQYPAGLNLNLISAPPVTK